MHAQKGAHHLLPSGNGVNFEIILRSCAKGNLWFFFGTSDVFWQKNVNRPWMCSRFSPFAWIVKSVNDLFPRLLWFWEKNLPLPACLHVKLLKLRESDTNGNSLHKNEVKRDYVKCWKIAFKSKFSLTVNLLPYH